MHKAKAPRKEYGCFEVFKNTFFPKYSMHNRIIDDPEKQGTEMARKTLKKLRQALC